MRTCSSQIDLDASVHPVRLLMPVHHLTRSGNGGTQVFRATTDPVTETSLSYLLSCHLRAKTYHNLVCHVLSCHTSGYGILKIPSSANTCLWTFIVNLVTSNPRTPDTTLSPLSTASSDDFPCHTTPCFPTLSLSPIPPTSFGGDNSVNLHSLITHGQYL